LLQDRVSVDHELIISDKRGVVQHTAGATPVDGPVARNPRT
jgi:hypothetical protein